MIPKSSEPSEFWPKIGTLKEIGMNSYERAVRSAFAAGTTSRQRRRNGSADVTFPCGVRNPIEFEGQRLQQWRVIPPVVSSPRRPMGARSGHRARGPVGSALPIGGSVEHYPIDGRRSNPISWPSHRLQEERSGEMSLQLGASARDRVVRSPAWWGRRDALEARVFEQVDAIGADDPGPP